MSEISRKKYGKVLQELTTQISERLNQERLSFQSKFFKEKELNDNQDITINWYKDLGSREHVLTSVMNEVVDIFSAIGYTVATGPEAETSWHNFDALNTPEDHPSRDKQDTFYLENGDLLRCHTSPVQIRYMKSNKPPIRIISPGRCYRRDTPDSTHSANFHQIEGLFVDQNVTLADLKGTISYFAKELLGKSVKTRFRPHFFPFTEPSFEVDFMHPTAGWIEVLGAGLVHPNVFKNIDYDSDKVSGFAFGMGIERIAMILYNIKDIRDLYENDQRFLRQF